MQCNGLIIIDSQTTMLQSKAQVCFKD